MIPIFIYYIYKPIIFTYRNTADISTFRYGISRCFGSYCLFDSGLCFGNYGLIVFI